MDNIKTYYFSFKTFQHYLIHTYAIIFHYFTASRMNKRNIVLIVNMYLFLISEHNYSRNIVVSYTFFNFLLHNCLISDK